jgi:flavin reductase (DIM6/NTAB) family NADH-FMN oxidoreductase RutF
MSADPESAWLGRPVTPAGDGADAKAMRRALGTFATGVTVVTVGGAAAHGMTANSFTAVSLDPPLVLICVQHDAIMHASLLDTGSFGVSILAAGQESVARHFADSRRSLGIEQFECVEWLVGPNSGAPLIVGAVAHVECDVWRTYDGGDHTIFLGQVTSIGHRSEGDVLAFLDGRFRHLDRERTDVPS